jgi:hypothetical protein
LNAVAASKIAKIVTTHYFKAPQTGFFLSV